MKKECLELINYYAPWINESAHNIHFQKIKNERTKYYLSILFEVLYDYLMDAYISETMSQNSFNQACLLEETLKKFKNCIIDEQSIRNSFNAKNKPSRFKNYELIIDIITEYKEIFTQ
jgi:hypothetical protein